MSPHQPSPEPSQTEHSSFVPMSDWGKDHWSTLAYINSVMIECGGFEVGMDARMKSNRRNFRVLSQDCPLPLRPSRASAAVVMRPEHATRTKSGAPLDNHDDWSCVQDFAAAGLLTTGPSDVEPGHVLHLSPMGAGVLNSLLEHKRGGGNFSTFLPTVFSVPTERAPSPVIPDISPDHHQDSGQVSEHRQASSHRAP